jgi:transposase
MARPTKLTPQVKERVVAAVRAGSYAEAAARSAGIGESTYYRWLQRGEEETEGIYREFRDVVRQAEAEAEVHPVAIVRRAMTDGDWRAAIAFLERRYPARWHRQQATELTGAHGGPIRSETATRVDLTKLTDDDLKALEELYARATESG